ncbi:MAG TPA: hypothetical protein VIV55_03750, partial [Flavobacterium sp.]
MKKIFYFKIKSVQNYCDAFFSHVNVGYTSFFGKNTLAKKLVFYGTLLLFGLGFTPNSYAQTVGEGGIKANFGVEADAYANFIGFSIVAPSYSPPPPPNSGPGANFLNTDDWFEKTEGEPVFWTGSGRGVINPGNNILQTRDSIKANNNYSFTRRQSEPPRTKVTTNGVEYLWVDSVYGRDYNVVGISGDNKDKTFFTSGADKNADNPAGWTLGIQSGGPQKDDIIDVMAHLRGEGLKDPTDADPRAFTTLWLFGAATLRSTSGDKHIDFEFFRTMATIEGGKLVNTGSDAEGGRTAFTFFTSVGPNGEPIGSIDKPGTILVSTDYSGGGRVPSVKIYVWMKESVFNAYSNSAPGRPFDVVSGSFTKGTDSLDYGYAQILEKDETAIPDIYGRVNVEGSTLGTPWGTLYGQGATFSDYYQPLQHVEFGINITKFGLDKRRQNEDPCSNTMGSLLVKTRSSGGSLTSELKDFSGPYPFGNTETAPQFKPTSFTACANAANDQTYNLKSRIGIAYLDKIKFYLSKTDRDAGNDKYISAGDLENYPVPVLANTDKSITFYLRGNTSIAGCFSTAEFTIDVNALPTVSVSSPAICTSGLPATVTATPNPAAGPGITYTYAWTVPAGASAPGNVA